jgi:hypothetical protein
VNKLQETLIQADKLAQNVKKEEIMEEKNEKMLQIFV